MKNIAIFASGSGSNAEKIMEYFQNSQQVKVALVVSNNQNAFVLERAKKYRVPTMLLPKNWKSDAENISKNLKEKGIDLIVLAGFMQLIPSELISAFPNKIINIHPALLPKYGGKGMYGMHVHRAVKSAGDSESGISIHFVNEKYDEGEIILQKKCSISDEDTPESIQQKVQKLEHEYFVKAIEKVLG
ncbi:MAG: phosphoribosylglycinamide formyltransferase [Chitinophagales bacterium]